MRRSIRARLKMSERIETLMKKKKNFNANVDFYSATVYCSLGIQTDLFTQSLRSLAPLAGARTFSSSWRITGFTAR